MSEQNQTPTSIAWWESRAMWGILVTAAAQVARRIWNVEVDEVLLLDLVTSLATIVGLLFAWIGRVRATHPISMRKIVPGITLQAR